MRRTELAAWFAGGAGRMIRRAWRKHSPTDAAGCDVRVGDWVRVVSVPASIARMPGDAKRAFSRAVGKTFQIEAFDQLGCAELDLTGKVGFDTIWIEPSCVLRARRPKTHSLRFRRILAIRRKLDRPRWSFRYVGRYRTKEDAAKLVRRLCRFWLSHGWYVLERRREIHGTFSAPDATLRSKRQLEQVRKDLHDIELFASLDVARIRLESRAKSL